MNCPDIGRLQALLDGEISFRERAEFDRHLNDCPECARKMADLQENNNLVMACLGARQTESGELRVNSELAWARFQQLKGSNQGRQGKGGFFEMRSSMKKLVVAVALMAFIGLSFTSSTVRAAASDFLTLFRVDKVQTIAIDLEQLQNVGRVFKQKGVSLDIENFGSISNQGLEAPQTVSLEEARAKAGFALRTPGYLPASFGSPQVTFVGAGSVSFRLKVQNVNAVIKSLGGTVELPQALDGKEFIINTPNLVRLDYPGQADGAGRNGLTLSQFKSPEIKAPGDVDPEEIRAAILALPVIPDDIRKQLASLQDWQQTLVVPALKGKTEKVLINGSEAYFTGMTTDGPLDSGILVWQTDGIITLLQGNVKKAEIIKVAESLK